MSFRDRHDPEPDGPRVEPTAHPVGVTMVSVPKDEYERLVARLAKLNEQRKRVYDLLTYCVVCELSDEPETPKGEWHNFPTDETTWEVFPGAAAKAQEIIDGDAKPDKLALARELAKAARTVVDNQYAPTAALIDALGAFEASAVLLESDGSDDASALVRWAEADEEDKG